MSCEPWAVQVLDLLRRADKMRVAGRHYEATLLERQARELLATHVEGNAT